MNLCICYPSSWCDFWCEPTHFCCYVQALQLGQDANSPFGFFNGQRCQMCLRSDTLLKVMERLANPGNYLCLDMLPESNFSGSTYIFFLHFILLVGVRRVFIVEAGSKRVEGIISLSDIFKFLLS